MARQLKEIPIAGLHFELNAFERPWNRLDNCIIRDKTIDVRPGAAKYGPSLHATNTIPGTALLLAELRPIHDPAGTLMQEKLEHIRPDGTIVNSGWSVIGGGLAHDAVNEAVPDLNKMIRASVDGSNIQFSYSNQATVFTVIESITIRYMAQINPVNYVSAIETKVGSFLTGTIADTTVITEGTNAGGEVADQWQLVEIYLEKNPTTGKTWTGAEVTNLTTTFTYQAAPTGLVPAGWIKDPFDSGFYSTWTVVNSATPTTAVTEPVHAVAANVILPEELPFFAGGPCVKIGAGALTKQSYQFAGAAQPSTLTKIVLHVEVASEDGLGPFGIQLFHRSGGVDRDIGSPIVTTKQVQGPLWGPNQGVDIVTVESTVNPATGAAWTAANLNPSEFGFYPTLNPRGGRVNGFWLEGIGLGPANIAPVPAVNIAWVEVQVNGPSWAAGTATQMVNQIWVTDNDFERIDNPTKTAGFLRIRDVVTGPTTPERPDVTEFQEKLYIVNGTDQTYTYPSANAALPKMTQFAGQPVGRCVATFSSRLFLGDVTEAGTRRPNRITWSKIGDATNWTAASAGDADIIEGGEGGFVKLAPLDLSTMIAYRELAGVHRLLRTGDARRPFIDKLINSKLGCPAGATVVTTLDKNGQMMQLFLARGPGGYSVYAFTGDTFVPIGGPIDAELRDRTNIVGIRQGAFAIEEPFGRHYLLFLPETGQTYPKQCWAFDIRQGEWTRWVFPWEVTAAGYYTVLLDGLRPQLRYAVLAARGEWPALLDPAKKRDVLIPGQADQTNEFNFADNVSDDRTVPIGQVLETGDYGLGPGLGTTYNMQIGYYNIGDGLITLSHSIDGGRLYRGTTSIPVGYPSGGKEPTYRDFSITVETGRRFRTRLNVAGGIMRLASAMIEEEARGERA